jgi:hypothetical protein
MVTLKPNGYSDDEFITVYEAVALSDLDERTIRNWIARDKIGVTRERPHKGVRVNVGDLKDMELNVRPKGYKHRGIKAIELGDEPISLYEKEGWSIRRLAVKFNVSYGCMHGYLTRKGVTLRPRGGPKGSHVENNWKGRK